MPNGGNASCISAKTKCAHLPKAKKKTPDKPNGCLALLMHFEPYCNLNV